MSVITILLCRLISENGVKGRVKGLTVCSLSENGVKGLTVGSPKLDLLWQLL